MLRDSPFHCRSNKTSDGLVVDQGMAMLKSAVGQPSKNLMPSMT